MTVISVFGDSNTYGAWDTEHQGWVNRLRRHLDKSHDLIYNLGISGETSTDVLKRFDVECRATRREAVQYKEPFIIMIAIGGNDSYLINGRPKVPVARFRSNIIALIKKAKGHASKIFLLELTPVDESKTDPIPWNKSISYRNDRIAEYNSALRDACKKEKAYLIKNNLARLRYRDLLEDGVHLNSKGHKTVSDAVRAALIKEGVVS